MYFEKLILKIRSRKSLLLYTFILFRKIYAKIFIVKNLFQKVFCRNFIRKLDMKILAYFRKCVLKYI